MKFGIDQINKPTPRLIVRLQMAVGYLCGSALLFTGFFCRHFGIEPTDFNDGLGITFIAVNFLAVLFGEKPIEQNLNTDDDANT